MSVDPNDLVREFRSKMGTETSAERLARLRLENPLPVVEPTPPAKKAGGGKFSIGGLFDAIDDRLPESAPEFLTGKVIFGVLAVIIVVLVALGLIFAFSGGDKPTTSPPVAVVLGTATAIPVATQAPSAIATAAVLLPTPTPVPTVDWSPGAVKSIAPIERSALRLGLATPADWVLAALMLAMALALIGNIVLDWREGSQDSGEEFWERFLVAAQSSCGLIAGLLSGLVIAWTANDGLAFLVAAVVFAVIWAGAGFRLAKDGSPLNAGFVLAAASLAIRGVSEIPVGIAHASGRLGVQAWSGFYSPSGVVALLSGLRFHEAALTLLVYGMLAAAVVVSGIEALRKYVPSQALLAALIVIGAVVLGMMGAKWLSGMFDVSSPDKLLAAEVAKPILGWIFGVLLSLIAALGLKGKSVRAGKTTLQMAQLQGPQGVLNFVMLITTASVAINLLGR